MKKTNYRVLVFIHGITIFSYFDAVDTIVNVGGVH